MYVKTILLTADILTKLRSGEIVLRSGQWVRTHPSSRPSRYVGTWRDSKTLWASHYSGGTGEQRVQFMSLAEVRRECPGDFF